MPVLGTSPIAIGVPRANGTPIVLRHGKRGNDHRRDGASAPVRQAVAAWRCAGCAGPCHDRSLQGGNAPAHRRPQGFGLGFMIECLCSLLTGFPRSRRLWKTPSLRNEYVLNALCIAIDPERAGCRREPRQGGRSPRPRHSRRAARRRCGGNPDARRARRPRHGAAAA